jgi:hypothetical protein
MVARVKRPRVRVRWDSGTTQQVDVVSQQAHWDKTGHGLVPVRRVFVHDRTGMHRDGYFCTTALSSNHALLYCRDFLQSRGC